MSADESVKRYDVTFVEDMQSGETAEHTIRATHVEIVDGNLCFYDGSIAGGFFKKRKLVAAYAAGVWTFFEEYEDSADLGPESPVFDEEAWNRAIGEAAERTRNALRGINPNLGKDGAVDA